MIFKDLFDFFAGGLTNAWEYKPNEEELAKTFPNEIRDAYQEMALQGRAAINPTEAAVKLLIERGTFHPRSGHSFSNQDFAIKSCYYTVTVDSLGLFCEQQMIFEADTHTGSCEANANLSTFAKLIDLANGQALAQTIPLRFDSRPSAAQICLQQLDTILTYYKGPGVQKLETDEYKLERQGTTVTLRHPLQSYPQILLLLGDVEQGRVELSYLSTIDTRNIDNTLQQITEYDFEGKCGRHYAEMIIASTPDSNSKDLPPLLSNDDLRFSWSVPKLNIDVPVDGITIQALTRATGLLVDSIQGDTYWGSTYRVVEVVGDIDIQDLQGQSLLKYSLCGDPITHGEITIETATEILRFVQAYEEQLRQGQDITVPISKNMRNFASEQDIFEGSQSQ